MVIPAHLRGYLRVFFGTFRLLAAAGTAYIGEFPETESSALEFGGTPFNEKYRTSSDTKFPLDSFPLHDCGRMWWSGGLDCQQDNILWLALSLLVFC